MPFSPVSSAHQTTLITFVQPSISSFSAKLAHFNTSTESTVDVYRPFIHKNIDYHNTGLAIGFSDTKERIFLLDALKQDSYHPLVSQWCSHSRSVLRLPVLAHGPASLETGTAALSRSPRAATKVTMPRPLAERACITATMACLGDINPVKPFLKTRPNEPEHRQPTSPATPSIRGPPFSADNVVRRCPRNKPCHTIPASPRPELLRQSQAPAASEPSEVWVVGYSTDPARISSLLLCSLLALIRLLPIAHRLSHLL